jgi:hypothetical protein
VYTLAQELLEISDQTSRKPWRCLTGHVDKEVNIAFGRFFSSSHRAEKPDITGAVERD